MSHQISVIAWPALIGSLREEQLIEQESAIDKLKQQSDALAAQHRLATEELVKLRQQSTNSTDLQASLAELEERMQSKEEEIEETEDRCEPVHTLTRDS